MVSIRGRSAGASVPRCSSADENSALSPTAETNVDVRIPFGHRRCAINSRRVDFARRFVERMRVRSVDLIWGDFVVPSNLEILANPKDSTISNTSRGL